MKKVKIYVTLRESILDPAGNAVKDSLHKLGHKYVKDARIGKFIQLELEDTNNIDEKIKDMCEKLLSNTVIEDYSYSID
ncbi:MAG: phosphoribosylformylglycinamidine synthase subunit PurS [Defluviitaleaceae bacterium]|nr:phosphoribosylformylglycinamidine synthase subunit PurS [Defluviitaleaceae bacterium]